MTFVTRFATAGAAFGLVMAQAACSSPAVADPAPSTSAAGPVTTTATSAPVSTTTTTVLATTTTVAAATTTAVTTPAVTTTAAGVLARRELGRSVEGRPITAIERGTPGGTKVVVLGVIHGDEDAGADIVDRLGELAVPAGIDLWLVPSMNPDGQANGTRTNANGVDLNRNFPLGWTKIGRPGDWQYSGTGPASEPETKAVAAFLEETKPSLVIWYHQDLNRIAPAAGRAGEIRRRYAELTGLPIAPVTGGTYTGVAAGWARRTLPGAVAFIVELGPTLSAEQADTHAQAVLAVAKL